MELGDRGETATHLIKDGDTKFTENFDEIFESEGIKVKRFFAPMRAFFFDRS